MPERPKDVDIRQSIRDIFFTLNAYRLDDRFVIRDGKRHPFALLCPGGGYSMVCSFIEGVPIAKALNQRGISAFILYYRVKKKAAYPAPQDDLARAVREILDKRDDFLVDADGYSIWGGSAGGHLAASFGTAEMGWRKYGLPKPGALVLAYPVITMDASLTHAGTRENLLGKNPTNEMVRLASIEKNVDAAYPPAFLWCGDADKVVSPENTRLLDHALTAAGVKHACRVYPGVGHGIGPGTGTSAEGWINEAIDFWMAQIASK